MKSSSSTLVAVLVVLACLSVDTASAQGVQQGRDLVVSGGDVSARAACPDTCLSGVCDQDTGTCVVDWGSGLDGSGPAPRQGCPRGFHGALCTDVCPANCVNSTCSQDSGQCTEGCRAGYAGTDCTADCPSGLYGDGCSMTCPEHCKNGTCSSQSGVCDSGCEAGFWGSDCSLGVQLSRSTSDDRRTFYSHLSAEGKSVLLYLLTSRYEHALARAQFEIERAVQDRNEIQHLLQG